MITVRNVIADVPRKRTARTVPMARRIGLTIHRCGFGSVAQMVIGYERMGWSAPPYGFYVDETAIYQLAAMTSVTSHAMRHNARRIGIGVAGDFRTRKPSSDSWQSAAELCGMICAAHEWTPYTRVGPERLLAPVVAGHDELPWGSSMTDDNGRVTKQCPGRMWPMHSFRLTVVEKARGFLAPRDAAEQLASVGITL
ncbi:MAG: peptidoglycan recognition family protein [Phycisphaerae bacterium]